VIPPHPDHKSWALIVALCIAVALLLLCGR
jgi:hypothetical protein